jgi:hypothetical protein
MGNVSSVSQTIKNDVINSFNSNCTNSVNITQTIEGIDFTGDCDNVNIENLASTSAECDMSQCAKTLAEYYNKATTDQKTAMDLFNISEKSENIEGLIKNKLTAKCKSQISAHQTIKDLKLNVDCKNFNIINKTDIQAKCALSLVENSISKLDNNSNDNQGGIINTSEILEGIAILSCILFVIYIIHIIFKRKN